MRNKRSTTKSSSTESTKKFRAVVERKEYLVIVGSAGSEDEFLTNIHNTKNIDIVNSSIASSQVIECEELNESID